MKKYEKKYIQNFIFIIVGLVLLINILNKSIPDFKVAKGELINGRTYSIFVDNNSLKRLKKNPYIYINNTKTKIEIIDEFKKYYKDYNKVIIKCNIKKVDKEVNISIYNGKKSFFKIFLECWEE